jgi:hypothetical protein
MMPAGSCCPGLASSKITIQGQRYSESSQKRIDDLASVVPAGGQSSFFLKGNFMGIPGEIKY